MKPAQFRQLTATACVIGVASAIVAGCAAPQAKSDSGAKAAAPALAPAVAPVAASTPALTPTFTTPAPVASAALAAPSPVAAPAMPAAATTAVAASSAPHFATPDAAMRYLVEAYNTNNETDIKHVTSPDSRAQFETERQWVKSFRFRQCDANGAPAWNYTCVLDIVELTPSAQSAPQPGDAQTMGEVTVLVAPAARPGYYLEANQGCGGG